MEKEPEILTEPVDVHERVPAAEAEADRQQTGQALSASLSADVLNKPLPEHIFTAFRNEIDERLKKIESFIDVQKQQEGVKLRDAALDIPKQVKIGRKKYMIRRLPAGYRVLMVNKLIEIAKLVPRQEPPSIEKLALLMQNKDEQTPEELAAALQSVIRSPGLLAQITPHVSRIFDEMLEVIQLAFQASTGEPKFDEQGDLLNAVVDLNTLRWELDDMEGLFINIMEMNLPIFFTIEGLRRSLSV